MYSPRNILFLVSLALLLTGCDPEELASLAGDSHAYQKDFHKSFDLKPGGRLSVESFNGPVEIAGWDQNKVEIDAVIYAATERLRDAIQIDVAATEEAVQIRTVRPVESHGNMGVRYVIKAPRKVNLDRIGTSNGRVIVDGIEGVTRVRTSNGSVQAARVRGDLDVQTSNGSVDVREVDGPANIRTTNGQVHADEIRGSLQAATSNGGIHVRLTTPEPRKPVKLSTTNGGIELTMDSLRENDVRMTTSNGGITLKLPSASGARLHARTSHSSVHTDFDVRREDDGGKSHMDGVIGGGGPTLELTTNNGAIRLLKL
jgi:DUF4097 and DUF4098 domain-containing protein YvlB